MTPLAKFLTAAVVAEGVALVALARDLHKVHVALDVHEMHAISTDVRFQDIRDAAPL